jgi:signal peptidase I
VLAVLFSALVGIGAGHTLIGSVSGSVSIVDGDSMEPNYRAGTRIYTAPILGCVERGEIVLLDDKQGGYALKRVIGLPGETVHLWRGYVFVNGRMLTEPYLPRYTFTAPDEQGSRSRFNLAASQFFVMGDNRTCSIDSRSYGPVEREQIKARLPQSESHLRPNFAPFTLPVPGQTLIQPLASGHSAF